MKPILKIVNTQQSEAFQIMKVNDPYFFPTWHFHPELEIMLVQEGSGIRFVGNSMERFQAGDLVLYGSNIPHLYRSDKEYYQKDTPLVSRATVVYFKENFLGESFWQLPPISPIKKLLALSKRGIKFKGEAKEELQRQVQQLDDQKNSIGRIIDLLSILKIMAETKEYELLLNNAFTKYVSEDECERINKVYQFIIDNYTENPTLERVSEVANMSATAFCRYFKSHTNKTYTQFLNDIKVDNACRLLIDNRLSISQICFETGFNNFTHFNDQFKKITGITPKQYQSSHLNK
ncbi:AraC family transcriptional regulator [Runella sp.]|uniref:AraC family transcriptional regulator n=1 Tax=Runella sp. TaxID=1960881 RepID=UPI003D0BEB59